MRYLRTPQQVIDALGGVDAVCELVNQRPPTVSDKKAAWHWAGRAGMFPANTYVVMQRSLRKRNYTAPAWLWNMRGIERRAA